MAESINFRDRYLDFIDQLVQKTLQGEIRSKEQVYELLVEGISRGTGEIFEQVLVERVAALENDASDASNELKQAKAQRRLRALKTVQAEWQRWQTNHQTAEQIDGAVQQITAAATGDRLVTMLQVLDANRNPSLTLPQWVQLANALPKATTDAALQDEMTHLSQGIQSGLADWQQIEPDLVSWMYDQSRTQIGFGGVPGQRGPWAVWAKKVSHTLPRSLFEALSLEHSPAEWARQQRDMQPQDLLELAIVLRCIQQGLITWFDKLVYSAKASTNLSTSVFVGFAVVWSQLAGGFQQSSLPQVQALTDACFLLTLQILRKFAQQPYFPLYGTIFASFSGQYLRDTLNYLDEPLRRAERTQEKARILTVLGYSFKAQGDMERALTFHQNASEIAREADDRPCEIANYNHLSRTYVALQDYENAIRYSQRALILSRQTGDRQGEANALANLGFSEVFQAQQLEADSDAYETATGYLQQGLQLSERLGDRQSQALCFSSLGIAQVVLENYTDAIAQLEKGIQAAQFSGDLYLQGLNLAYLGEAYYQLQQLPQAIQYAALGMYLLEQIASQSWRQPAGLLSIINGKMGDEAFQATLVAQRPQIIAVIGVDGYDHLPTLLQYYRD